MPKEYIFWGIMLFRLLCYFGTFSDDPNWKARLVIGGTIVDFILFGLLGWQVFGKAVK